MRRSPRRSRHPEHAEPDPLRRLVRQARLHGVSDGKVLDALGTVPRDRFVPEDLSDSAFDDTPLPIGRGQTISQPAMVAIMAEAARIGPDDRVLEVGTGSGYGAAVLRTLAGRVVTVERIRSLAQRAQATLGECGFDDIEVVVGDGTTGWLSEAPYDAIVVTAAGPDVPTPLIEQLVPGGRLMIPVGSRHDDQHLMRFTRSRTESISNMPRDANSAFQEKYRTDSTQSTPDYTAENLMAVRFVPLIGEHGF